MPSPSRTAGLLARRVGEIVRRPTALVDTARLAVTDVRATAGRATALGRRRSSPARGRVLEPAPRRR